jgi:hypothetical protein
VDRFSLFPDIAADRSARDPLRRSYCADGYRLAKTQGKPKLAKACQALKHKPFPSLSALARSSRVYRPFIANLKLAFNPAGHDRPNKPVNGVGT